MIDGLRPYPAMKESGVPWLGRVPEHWETASIASVGMLFKGSGGSKADEASAGVPCVRYGDLYTRYEFFIRSSRSFVTEERSKTYTPIAYGDVLFAASGETFEDIGRSAVNLMEGKAVCGGDVIVLRPQREMAPRFFGYATNSFSATWQKARVGKGFTIVHIYASDLKRIRLALPPIAEQASIVRFLDHADQLIRRYIATKRKLIKSLEEQKQAIIQRAVTRGLDSNQRDKSSGNRWFPEIPSHWDLLPLRRVIHRAVDGPHHSPAYLDDGIPFLSARNIRADRWSLDDAKFISKMDYDEFCKRVKPEMGDVLYTKGGTTGIARAVDLDFQFQVWVHVAVLKVNKLRITPEFLAAALNTSRCYEQSQLFTRGATNQDLGLGRMKDIVLPVPPLSEQEAITRFIALETLGLQHAIDSGRHEMDLLREYRTRLIADVVTGKLDVRAAAATLPETIDEPEEPDAAIEIADEDELADNGESETEEAAA